MKVFISYSRLDGAFAEKLRRELIGRGFEAYLDKEDILPGELWRSRLDGLILAADAVVFVMSPGSIASEICRWEIGRALELKKSLTPLYWCVVPHHDVPDGLSERNYVFFDAYERSGMADEAAFEASLTKLETALKVTDLLWVREHTKWVARAADWDTAEPKRPDGKLLRSADIAAVEGWLRLKPTSAPAIPAVLQDYLAASVAKEESDARRLRRTTGQGFVGPTLQAMADDRYEAALRLMAAGAVLAADVGFALVPELWTPRAIAQGRVRAVLRGHEADVMEVACSADGTRIVTVSKDKTARIWEAPRWEKCRILAGHDETVNTAAFSPDGRRIVTGSNDHTSRIWDAATGRQLAVLGGHPGGVITAVFSPDGRKIATAEGGGTICVWNAETGAKLVTLGEGRGDLPRVCFSPDGRTIMMSSWTRDVRLWDAADFREVRVLKGHSNAVMAARFSSDGTRIVTASHDKTARIWNSATGRLIAAFEGHTKEVVDAALSPDGTRVVTASLDSTARLWRADGTLLAVLQGHEAAVQTVDFSSDGARIVTASDDATARLWHAHSGRPIIVLRGHEAALRESALLPLGRATFTAKFLPDGRSVVSASNDATARIWEAAAGPAFATLEGHRDGVGAVCFSPDGRSIITSSYESTAAIWDADSGSQIKVLTGHRGVLNSATFSPDGRQVIIGSRDRSRDEDGAAYLWNVASGKLLGSLRGHDRGASNACFSPDGTRILTTAWESGFLWDAQTLEKMSELRGHGGHIASACFSPDGRCVVTASWDHTARLWDADGGQNAGVLPCDDQLNEVSFSPDGCRVLTAAQDGRAIIWDASSGRRLFTLEGHAQSLLGAAFSKDGTRIVTASADGTAKVWDAGSGRALAELDGHGEPVRCAVFSPEGHRVATAAWDGTARVWDAATGKELIRLDAGTDKLQRVVFHQNGRTLATSGEGSAVWLWDVSRSIPLTNKASVCLAAALARGVGHRNAGEAHHLLLQHAPDDLFEAVCDRLSEADINTVEEVVRAMAEPLHRGCYVARGASDAADGETNAGAALGSVPRKSTRSRLLAFAVSAALVALGWYWAVTHFSRP